MQNYISRLHLHSNVVLQILLNSMTELNWGVSSALTETQCVVCVWIRQEEAISCNYIDKGFQFLFTPLLNKFSSNTTKYANDMLISSLLFNP